MVPALAVFCVVLVIVGVVINVPTVYLVWRDRRDYPNAPMIEGLMQGLCDEMEEKKCTDRGRDLAERTLRLMEESRWPIAERRLIAKTLVLQRIGYAGKPKLRRTPAIRAAVVDQIEKLVMNSEYGLATVDFRSALACLRAQVAVDRWQYQDALCYVAAIPLPDMREKAFVRLGTMMTMQYFAHLDRFAYRGDHEHFRNIVVTRLLPGLSFSRDAIVAVIEGVHSGVSVPLALAELGAPREEVEAAARACLAWQIEHFDALREVAIAVGSHLRVARNCWDAGYSLVCLAQLRLPLASEAAAMFAKYVALREWDEAHQIVELYPDVATSAEIDFVYRNCGKDVLTNTVAPMRLPEIRELAVGETVRFTVG